MAERERADRWILVVEDNEDDERLVTRTVAKAGRHERMFVARDGAEGLETLRTCLPPSIVLLDLKLPRLSGVEVLSAIQDDDRLRALPIVILTSGGEPSEVAACYELGCNAFIRKSTDYETYIHEVTRTLEFWLDICCLPPIDSPADVESPKMPAREGATAG